LLEKQRRDVERAQKKTRIREASTFFSTTKDSLGASYILELQQPPRHIGGVPLLYAGREKSSRFRFGPRGVLNI